MVSLYIKNELVSGNLYTGFLIINGGLLITSEEPPYTPIGHIHDPKGQRDPTCACNKLAPG